MVPFAVSSKHSKTFTVRPLQALLEGRFAIAGDPDMPANMVYVDNVVEAIARSLEAPDNLGGSAYLVSDPEQLSLQAFYQYFARPSGASIHLVPARSADDVGSRPGWLAGLRAIALAPEVRALVHRIMDTDPVGALPRRLWEASPDMQRRLLKLFRVDAAVIYRPSAAGGDGEFLDYSGESALVSSGKLRRELGFAAAVPPSRAMALTLEWATEARLVKVEHPAPVVVTA